MNIFTTPDLRPDGWYWVTLIGGRCWIAGQYKTVTYAIPDNVMPGIKLGVWVLAIEGPQYFGAESSRFKAIHAKPIEVPIFRDGVVHSPKRLLVTCVQGHVWETVCDMADPNQEYVAMQVYCPQCGGLYLHQYKAKA